MKGLVAYSPEFLALDTGDENDGVFDALAPAAVNAQSATANTPAIEMLTTEHSVLPVYETRFLADNQVANLMLLTPDANVSSLDRNANEAVANVVPQFLLRRTAPPVTRPNGNTNAVVAEWEGYVTQISDKTIEARLTGLTGEGVAGEVEEATIPKSEIADADQSLLALGSLFRLCISYEKTAAGERRRYSTLVFRRLPAYRQEDLDEAHKRTRARLNGLRVE